MNLVIPGAHCCGETPDGDNCCTEYDILYSPSGIDIDFDNEGAYCNEDLIDEIKAIIGSDLVIPFSGKTGSICRWQDSFSFSDGTGPGSHSISLSVQIDLSDYSAGAYHTGICYVRVTYSIFGGGSNGNSEQFVLTTDLPCDGNATLSHSATGGDGACFVFNLSSPSVYIEFDVP